jgi:hypothetical protein
MPEGVRVYIQDHSFLLTDSGADMPFDTMDYCTGLGGVMTSAMMVYAGIDSGTVTVTATTTDRPPALDTGEQWDQIAGWDDIADLSLHVPNGQLTVERLAYGPFDDRPDLPVLSPHRPGHYRIRLHASGRDRHYDQTHDDSGERFHIVTWPAPPQPPLIIKATSRCGYGLRLNTHETPPTTIPGPPASEEEH